jgi:hypothetical protein
MLPDLGFHVRQIWVVDWVACFIFSIVIMLLEVFHCVMDVKSRILFLVCCVPWLWNLVGVACFKQWFWRSSMVEDCLLDKWRWRL